MRKLQFVEDWEQHDPDTYEWLKYKIAADIGGTPEREAFALFERLQVNKKGEIGYRLFRERVEKDPNTSSLLKII